MLFTTISTPRARVTIFVRGSVHMDSCFSSFPNLYSFPLWGYAVLSSLVTLICIFVFVFSKGWKVVTVWLIIALDYYCYFFQGNLPFHRNQSFNPKEWLSNCWISVICGADFGVIGFPSIFEITTYRYRRNTGCIDEAVVLGSFQIGQRPSCYPS